MILIKFNIKVPVLKWLDREKRSTLSLHIVANTWNQKLDSGWLVTDAHTCNMSKGELLIPSIKEVITI